MWRSRQKCSLNVFILTILAITLTEVTLGQKKDLTTEARDMEDLQTSNNLDES